MYQAFAEALAEAGLCGDLEVSPPATWNDVALMTLPSDPDVEREFHIRVTNLAGKGVPADLEVKADPTCGELDPNLPAEIDESGELTLTFKGKGEEACVETLSFEATRIYTYPTNLRPPKEPMPLYVVRAIPDIGVGAVQSRFRTAPPHLLGVWYLGDQEILEKDGLLTPLDLKGLEGQCKLLAPLQILTQEYSAAVNQPGHRAQSSMKAEVDPETGTRRLILEAEAQASPLNPREEQPPHVITAFLQDMDPSSLLGAPVLYVVDIRVPPQMQGMSARVRMLWTVDGEKEESGRWWFSIWTAELSCSPGKPHNPNMVRYPEGVLPSYSLLAQGENLSMEKEVFFYIEHLPEHMQIAVLVSGYAQAMSEVKDVDELAFLTISGQVHMRARMEVQLLPDLPPAGSNSGP